MSVSSADLSRPIARRARSSSRASTRASSSVLMNAPSPTLTSSTIASAPPAIFFDMMLRRDQRDVVDRRRHVSQRVEHLVRRDEIALSGRRWRCRPRVPVRRTRPPSARRGSRGSTRACRACRRCGRARGRTSSRKGTPHAATIGPTAATSCRPRRRSSACRRPCGRARRPGRTCRRCATIASVSADVSRRTGRGSTRPSARPTSDSRGPRRACSRGRARRSPPPRAPRRRACVL